MRWKMGPDMSRIRGLEVRGPSEDCLSGWVVYSLVKQEGERVRRLHEAGSRGGGGGAGGAGGRGGSAGEEEEEEEEGQQQLQEQEQEEEEEASLSPITEEQADLEGLALAYLRHEQGLHVTSDPLGWGLMGWKTQKLGAWAESIRARLRVLAPTALAVESGMMLPFRLYGAILGGRWLGGGEGREEVGREGGGGARR